jgi:CHAD domain-containing protein
MISSGYLAFTLAGFVDFDRTLEKIRVLFPVQEEPVLRLDEEYLDTFDWRLYIHGYVFRQRGARFLLSPIAGTPCWETSGPRKSRLFWWDFPEGVLRERLASLSGPRALCPLLQIIGRRRSFRLCNRDDKTVLRFSLDTGDVFVDKVGKGAFAPYLRLEEVRGYRKPFHRVAELLKKDGLRELATDESFLQLALRVIDRRPADYSSKFSVSLRPEQKISMAISSIGLLLHTAMIRNLPGVLGDVDPEFLHDFRVAIRRTRSLLSQLKTEIPPGQAGFFQQEFQWLGSVTGPVRDLDVCLQKEEKYRGLLPETLHPGLAQFLEEIQRQRKARLAKMQDDLQSTRAKDLLANWHDFLTALPVGIEWPAGQVSCRTVAVKVLRTCFRRLVRHAALILEGEGGDAAMHRARIQAKKLRYLTEFFRPLFPAVDSDNLLQQLHGLQDDLGDFNDLTVQIKGLQQRRDVQEPGRIVRDSLDGLLSGLAVEQKRIRKRCRKNCRMFVDQERKHLFGDVFKKKQTHG